MEAVTGYKKLIVYQKAKILVREVYTVSKNFPREELRGLTSQARRSAISIVLNIVEGYSKSSTKEFITDWQKSATFKSQMNAKRLHISPVLEGRPWSFLPSDVNLNSKTPAFMLEKFIRFLDIAIGSANELAACLELALELKFMNKGAYDQMNSIYTEVSKLLYTFQKSLKRRIREQSN